MLYYLVHQTPQKQIMKILNFIYNGKNIDFEVSVKDNVMVNATQMAKAFGKLPKDFLKNDDVNAFIKECLKKENSPFLGVKNEEDLVKSKQKSGTWMHRILALKFAAWLDPAFDLWIYITIDKIINQHFHEQREAMVQKINIKQQKEQKKLELIEKYPEMQDYFDLDDKEKDANNKRIKAVKDQFKQLNLEFENIN